MKKIRRIIIIISVLLILLLGFLVGYHFYNSSHQKASADIPSAIGDDEYLLNSNIVKAPQMKTGVWIEEGSDGKFSAEDGTFKKSLGLLKNSFADRVYIKSRYFTLKKGNAEEGKEALLSAIRLIKETGKKVIPAFDFSFKVEEIAENIGDADGIMLVIPENLAAQEINKKAAEIKKATAGKKITVFLPIDFENASAISEKSIDSVYVLMSEKYDSDKVRTLSEKLSESGISLICGIDLDAVDCEEITADTPLINLYNVRECENITERCFSSLTAIKENPFNCYGAVKTYISEGICPEIAFRTVGVDRYGGETEEAEYFTAEFTVYGSNLFPIFIDGENYGIPEKGSMAVSVDLENEENILNITQNGNGTEYRINCVCDSDLVRYIMPSEEIEAQPKEKITIMIIAHSKADITVKLGTEKFKAICEEDAKGYTAFVSQITMPDSAVEVASLGKISVIASLGEKTIQLEGPRILPGQEMTTTAPVGTGTPLVTGEETTKFDIGNYLPEITNDAFKLTERLTTTTVYTPSTTYQYTPYTGNQMCIVTSAYADTKPITDNDDLVPYYTPLAAGTMDYVTGESSGYNVDDDETEYYYELQSGRKIKREAVQLIPKQDMGNNALNVLSSVCSGGEIKITLSTNWKVPYDLSYAPQDYYHGFSKNYNVTSFTASVIEFTFHYTNSASGTIDTSGSDVVSSAYWNVNEANKTAKLIMPLKGQGVYYGSSVEYDTNGNMVITINRKPVGANGAVVVLDAGHGGRDPGAAGLQDQVKESDVNLLVTYAAMEELQKRGVTVYLTRYGDDYMLLEERKAITRGIKPDLFVSIHSNGSENKNSKGTSTYYFKPFSFRLATNIYNELLSVHRNSFYYGRQELYNDLADKVQYYPFGVTRIEDCPSVLIEIGYVTNDEECYKLIDRDNQKLLGKAIADGIVNTLS